MATTTLAPTLNTSFSEPRLSTTHRVLVITENRVLQKTLQRLFSSEGYDVEIVADDLVGLEILRKRSPSALILDLRHPASVGWDLCREIAELAPDLPFVILSSNFDIADKILLLEIGADDYLPLPFLPRELVARLRSLIRRVTPTSRKRAYVFENVVVDFLRMEVTRGSEKVPLTAKEFKTLEFLTKRAQQVVSREKLLNEVWGYQNYPCTRTVDNHILRLRQKLESDPSLPSHFLTVHGVGYKFVP